jgi:hypothetical protein
MEKKYIGRIDYLLPEASQFNMNDDKPVLDHTFSTGDPTKGIIGQGPVGELFFSDHNLNILHEGVRYSVYTKSNKTISRQSDFELKIVMRSIYLQYSKNMPYNIVSQVRALNSMVLDFCVDQIISAMGMYKTYTKELTSLPVPLPHSVNVSNKGTRSLMMKDF